MKTLRKVSSDHADSKASKNVLNFENTLKSISNVHENARSRFEDNGCTTIKGFSDNTISPFSKSRVAAKKKNGILFEKLREIMDTSGVTSVERGKNSQRSTEKHLT
ncbi:hypothetical protein RIR_jg9086.t1 [Rhizophagus irregularis DAOM 181602=DAOM 197198]|nr:hypothetical protein RIR_jg9086.t1 [Rhizophagus irregularis DAOM 181602=DAOM 197198]